MRPLYLEPVFWWIVIVERVVGNIHIDGEVVGPCVVSDPIIDGFSTDGSEAIGAQMEQYDITDNEAIWITGKIVDCLWWVPLSDLF
jgi:hypothetical protein